MDECVFCEYSKNVEADRQVYEYDNWRLALQVPAKRLSTRQAAGLLISKRHFKEFSQAADVEMREMGKVIKDAAEKLCQKVGVMYTGQEIVGFNQGAEAGQTVFHCHIHILPVAVEDPQLLKGRAGIGGAFEALRRERLGE